MSTKKPEVSSGFAQRELDKAEKQFEEFNDNIKELTTDVTRAAPRTEQEPVHKMSQREMQNADDIYIKPMKSVGDGKKFNEKFREGWDYDKQYIKVKLEHKELIGENIEQWTKPYTGVPAEFWVLPTTKPVWIPRHVANQVKRKYYARLKMDEQTVTGADGTGSYYGKMVVSDTVQRLDCNLVSTSKTFSNRHF